MIKRLKSFGCSFIFGTDLPDDGRDRPYAKISSLTFPALIAERKNLIYECYARPGAGNFEILNRLIDQLSLGTNDGDESIYMINWTYVDRFSYIDVSKSTGRNPYNPWGWSSILPTENTEIAKTYYQQLHAQTRDQFETLICVKAAIDSLRSMDIPFIMTWTDSLMWERESWCPQAILFLQDTVSPWLSGFDAMSFVSWSKKHGYPISDTLHPLAEAHRAAADQILTNWEHYIRS